MRYSTDEQWLVPHFEKMLYDNALIISWLSTIYAYQPQPIFYQRVQETVQWLKNEMLLADNVFASSLDADSEGEEGKYYVWSFTELQAVLGDKAEAFLHYYGGSKSGNWEGKNILHRNHQQESELSEEKINVLKKQLLAVRQKRQPPECDDKVLLDWNALLIAALAKASLIFNEADWLVLAENCYFALQKLLRNEEAKIWYHCYRDCQAKHVAVLEDYAYIIQAAIQLYSVTANESYLMDAEKWLEELEELFLDKNNFLYNQTANLKQEKINIIAEMQPITDNATPSGNGVMVLNLMHLGLITHKQGYLQRAEKIMSVLQPILATDQAWQLSSFSQASAWYYKGVKLEADWREKLEDFATVVDGGFKPHWLLVQKNNQPKINCCNREMCFAVVDDINEIEQ